MPFVQRLLGKFGRFSRDERGATAVVFAVVSLPLMMCVGASIDVARMYQYRQKMQVAAETALQSAMSGAADRPAALRIADARSAYASFAPANGVAVTAPAEVAVAVDPSKVSASVTVHSSVNLVFGELFHMPNVNLAVVVRSEQDLGAAQQRRMLCHIGRPEDVQRLKCGTFL
jgi:Flp pilus assembly protein TadG